MRDRIMIIGAGDFQVPLIEYAASKYDVVLVAPVISQELRKLASSCYELDVRAKDEILKIAESEQIRGVITDQTDIPVRTVAYVAEKMGLPGIGYETSRLFTDKSLMAEKLEELGIGRIPTRETGTAEEAVSFMEELGCEVLIKPVDSQGSRGIFVCGSKDELREKYEQAAKFSSDHSVLVQKYIRGREFFAEGIVFDGKAENLIIGDTIYFNEKGLFAAKRRIVPSTADQDLVRRVGELNLKIIQGFGLKQGITHSEYIMSGDDIYLIETAARGGGVYISSDLISLLTGLRTEEFLTNIAVGKQEGFPEIEKDRCAAGYMAFFIPKGEVISVEGRDETAALPYVHRNQLYKIHEGMVQGSDPSDKTSRFALIVSADSHEELSGRMEEIKNMLKIKVRTGSGICGPVWE